MLTDVSSQASQVNIMKLHQLKVACNCSKYTIALKPIHILLYFQMYHRFGQAVLAMLFCLWHKFDDDPTSEKNRHFSLQKWTEVAQK